MATIEQGTHAAALARMVSERKQADDERAVIWAFFWTLFAFKLASVGVLFYWIGFGEFGFLISATTWPWLVIPGVAIAGPVAYRLRLRRVRRCREALRRAEFAMTDNHSND